jgi:hypothetical protein
MASIRGSVGKFANGTKQCFNFAPDQFTVIKLLNEIAAEDGGAETSLDEDVSDIKPGFATPELVDAIKTFQTRQKLLIDGHVDPGEHTIRRLSALSAVSTVDDSDFAEQEKDAIQTVIDANRPFAGVLITNSISELSAIQGGSRSNSVAVDALASQFKVTPLNQDKFLPKIIENYTKLLGRFPGVAAQQFPIDFATFLDENPKLAVDAHARILKTTAFSDPPNGMFFTPTYREFDPSKPLPFEGLFARVLSAIQLHEMSHFFLGAIDGNPKTSTADTCLNLAQSYQGLASALVNLVPVPTGP